MCVRVCAYVCLSFCHYARLSVACFGISATCNRQEKEKKKASNRFILLEYIVMIHLSSLEDIYNHTTYTEEIRAGINPPAVN